MYRLCFAMIMMKPGGKLNWCRLTYVVQYVVKHVSYSESCFVTCFRYFHVG